MVNYISTPYTIVPPLEDYGIIIEIIPVKEILLPDSLFWEYREDFNTSKKVFGNITVLNRNGKLLIGMHAAFRSTAPSTIRFLEDDGWIGDSEYERIKAFKSCLEKVSQIVFSLRGENKIISPLLLSKDYKTALRKHMSNIEYFVKYIEKYMPDNLNWTIFYQEPKRIKSNKIKIEKIIDNVTSGI
jgi:hypothetical protein